MRRRLPGGFLKLLRHVCEDFGCTAEVLEDQFFPATVNTKEMTDMGRKAIEETSARDAL